MNAAEHLALLRTAGLAPKKSFGQNFLVSDGVIATIAAACIPDGERDRAHVVELGAGTGALTAALCLRAARVTAVERDWDLVPVLAEAMQGSIAAGRLALVEGDAQSLDLGASSVACATPPRRGSARPRASSPATSPTRSRDSSFASR